MSFTISIDDSHKIVHYKHIGIIGLEDIGKAWAEMLKLEEFTNLNYNLLSDYTQATFDLTVENIEEITGFLYNLKHILKNKKQAFIVANPNDTALAMLFEAEVYEKVGFVVGTFTTKEAALKWISK
jgi:hypothetical protein